jgi:hypothetical protein
MTAAVAMRSRRERLFQGNQDPRFLTKKYNVRDNVADPDPNPSDQYVFGPPGSGSGSISQRHGSGSGSSSGSFNHQAKMVRKTLIPPERYCFVPSF